MSLRAYSEAIHLGHKKMDCHVAALLAMTNQEKCMGTQEITTLQMLRETVARWRAAGDSVALVPTMGALHAGHMALVNAAQAEAKRVIVSIFVNPTQFGPGEDFTRYPRPIVRDMEYLRKAGVDAAWLPSAEQMYPQGFKTSIHVAGVSAGLEGDARPGHFDGVATVVAKLLLQVMPDVALFGEKDYQQLCVVQRLAQDLNIPSHIVGVPTVREADGLALSSRNMYLTAEQMYPQGFKTSIHVAGVSAGLEGDARPGHFDGVATVVAKLLLQVMPDVALFGEKDYQQLCVVQRLAQDLNIPSHIVGVPTVREADGLALSSRNMYLTAEQRSIAPALYNELKSLAQNLAMPANAGIQLLIDNAKANILAAGFAAVDYLELRDAQLLEPLVRLDRAARLIAAARLGTTRLLDNLAVEAAC
jgi:pantoate--beta-alanine ligase